MSLFFDPFDIVGIIRKKDQKNRYWLTDGIGGPKAEEVNVKADKADELRASTA